jgi:hypothetical protein
LEPRSVPIWIYVWRRAICWSKAIFLWSHRTLTTPTRYTKK